jgi:hypothetical protein
MVFAGCVAEVVIASPHDADRLRTAIGHALNRWNSASAHRYQTVLMPSDGDVGTADHGEVFIAVFDPMRRDVVGVLGEVERARRAGKLVLAWLIAEAPSAGLSADAQAWLGEVTQRLTKEKVSPRYIGRGDALLENRLQTAITDDLNSTNLSVLTEELESAAAAREVTIYRTPVGLLGPQFWAVTVVNHGSSLTVGLQVSVAAVDSEGNDLPDGARRSTQEITDVFAKLKIGPWPDQQHAVAADRPPFLISRMDIIAAHNAVAFPRWLRPDQRASALYWLEPNASLRVRIQFEDETGAAWSRVDDAEPERVSPISST